MNAHPFGMHVAQECQVDLRLVFLARAAARHFLVEQGEMGIDEAFDELVESLTCTCPREMVERSERSVRPRSQRGEVRSLMRPLPPSCPCRVTSAAQRRVRRRRSAMVAALTTPSERRTVHSNRRAL